MREVDPIKISKFCEDIIRGYVSPPITIKPESNNPYESRYSLVSNSKEFDNPSSAISDRGDRQLNVFPLFLSAEINENFWIYFSIAFDVEIKNKKAKYSFDGISLAIFKGLATDDDKDMLFRAEWDNKDYEEGSVRHPQPHWHLHFVKEKLPPIITENFTAFCELLPEAQGFVYDEPSIIKNKEFSISKFHFAMGAKLDDKLKDKEDYHDLNEDSLKKWLTYTLKHITEQLEYSAS